MCLTVDDKYTKQPNKSIRWKILRVFNGEIRSMFRYCVWNKHKYNVAHLSGEPASDGFHVLLTKAAAVQELKDSYYNNYTVIIVKLRVEGFLYGGNWGGTEYLSETWKKAKILEIYTPSGKKKKNV